MATIKFPRQFLSYTEQRKTHTIEGSCVEDLLSRLTTRFPLLIGPVFSDELEPQPFVGLFVDNRPVITEEDRRCLLGSDAQLILISAVAGG